MMTEIPLFKVVVVGDGTVGKTSLIRRYCEGKFDASRVATIGVDFYTQRVQLASRVVKLSIWDMAGQERFEVVRAGFYRGSRAAALVYDVTNPDSLMHLKRWREEVFRALPGQPFVVVGNKLDLDRAVRRDIAALFARYVGAPYLETSALTGDGLDALFKALARLADREAS
jgi:small GTP-binding protein